MGANEKVQAAHHGDTLAEWLFYRFTNRDKDDDGEAWEALRRNTFDPDTGRSDQDFWQHEADAVRRAVARGGFKKGRRSAT